MTFDSYLVVTHKNATSVSSMVHWTAIQDKVRLGAVGAYRSRALQVQDGLPDG